LSFLLNIRNVHIRLRSTPWLVESPRYKLESRGFDSRWCHWNFSFT